MIAVECWLDIYRICRISFNLSFSLKPIKSSHKYVVKKWRKNAPWIWTASLSIKTLSYSQLLFIAYFFLLVKQVDCFIVNWSDWIHIWNGMKKNTAVIFPYSNLLQSGHSFSIIPIILLKKPMLTGSDGCHNWTYLEDTRLGESWGI